MVVRGTLVRLSYDIVGHPTIWHAGSRRLSLGIDNIFDLTYYEHLSRRIGDVPLGFVNFGRLNEPGRAFWFRIVLNM